MKKLGTVEGTHDLSTEETETSWGSLADKYSQISNPQANEKVCLNKLSKEDAIQRMTSQTDLCFHMHMHTCTGIPTQHTNTYICIHTYIKNSRRVIGKRVQRESYLGGGMERKYPSIHCSLQLSPKAVLCSPVVNSLWWTETATPAQVSKTWMKHKIPGLVNIRFYIWAHKPRELNSISPCLPILMSHVHDAESGSRPSSLVWCVSKDLSVLQRVMKTCCLPLVLVTCLTTVTKYLARSNLREKDLFRVMFWGYSTPCQRRHRWKISSQLWWWEYADSCSYLGKLSKDQSANVARL